MKFFIIFLFIPKSYAHVGDFFNYDSISSSIIKSKDPFSIYKTSLSVKKNGPLIFSFIIPSNEILKYLKIDLDNNYDIDQKEFETGYVSIDKWIRSKISLSGNGTSCMLKRSEYWPESRNFSEILFRAKLEFKCKKSIKFKLKNGLAQSFGRPIFSYIKIVKPSKTIKLSAKGKFKILF